MRLLAPIVTLATLVIAHPALATAQNTSWLNFENRARLALAPDPNGSVVAFGGDRGSRPTVLGDTWSLSSNAGWGLLGLGDGPESRSGHALGFHSGAGPVPPRTVLFGGTTATSISAETWVYNGNNWSLVTPLTTPLARTGHGVASDVGRNVVVMFGGSGNAVDLNDTWEWDGLNWLARGTGGPAPSRRSGHAMAWNEYTGRVVMFGGNPALSETWEFDDAANAWVQRLTAPGNTPPGRVNTTLAYDRFNRNVVLFGGRDASGSALGDTWVWDPALPPAGGWVLRNPTSSPSPRYGHAMAYDTGSQSVILVGGTDATGNRPGGTYEWDGVTWRRRTQSPQNRFYAPMTYDSARSVGVMFGGYGLNETWELSAGGWALRTPSVAPSPRGGHAIAYDRSRQRTVVFGGGDGSTSMRYRETWEWDGTSWQQRNTQAMPPGVVVAAMTYDEARREIVFFGGQVDAGQTMLDETWTYDGTNWVHRSPATSPPARAYQGMAYDRRRQRVVLFGGLLPPGQATNDTWEWDGSTWTEVPVAVQQRPSPRGTYITYDEARGRVTLLGGHDGATRLGDTWEFDGTTWHLLSPTKSPSARGFASAVYSEATEQTWVFGGFDWQGVGIGDADTWYHQSLLPARFRTRNAQNQPIGPGCAGSAGVPSLRLGIGERPWLGDTFTVHLTNVPANPLATLGLGTSQLTPGIPLGFLGMGSCLLHTNPLVFLPVSVLGTVDLTVPVDTGLGQARLVQQAFTYDPAANLLGLTASDLAEAIFGVR